jgi:hypothetical protein
MVRAIQTPNGSEIPDVDDVVSPRDSVPAQPDQGLDRGDSPSVDLGRLPVLPAEERATGT